MKTHQSSASTTITSAAMSTSNANDLLVAFITSDGPTTSGAQGISSVTGGGLVWKLRQRTNAQPGTAEIWEAVAPLPLTNVTVTAQRKSGSYVGSLDVVAFSGADTTTDGAVGTGNGASGAPTVTLTTTRLGSWVWGVGNDWDSATSRTLGGGQTLFDQFLASVGDTYWVQSQTAAGNPITAPVTINDTAPTNDHWDLSAIEVIPAVPAVLDTMPPSTPTNLMASAVNSNEVSLTWSASSDNVGVAGYDILRNGSLSGMSTGPSYTDTSALPSTSYTYTVEAYDAAGNVSSPSTAAAVTTPAPTPPAISGVAATNVTSTSATIIWTTDIPSSSQVFYGPTTAYGQSITLDTTQVTAHSQTISGLTASTTYHFEVQSSTSANTMSTSGDNTVSTQASNITLPDLEIKVPTNLISIGTNGSTGHRQLQYTHDTWDAGSGPFEIDPTYNSSTGTSTFTQAIYRSTSPGVWTLDHSVPLAATGIWDPPSDYNFPMTKFTLNTVNADGSLGSVVATSPKTDYCITGDVYIGGVPNTPNQTSPPQSNCTDPTKPLGWSVGWADEYDQTDAGQPIDLSSVPNGTYILHAQVDPNHVLTESDTTNDVTDTLLQVSGNSVSVISQTNPGTTPPTINITSPTAGANVSGTVAIQASASATAPATVSSVQFLLDGQPLGSPVTSGPYIYNWTIGSAPLGAHNLSARVTDSSGNVATAASVAVMVVSGGGGGGNGTPPTVAIINPANGQVVSGTTPVAANATASSGSITSVQFLLDGTPLGNAVTSSPYSINWDTTHASAGTHVLSANATDSTGSVGTSATVTVTVQNPAPPMTCFVLQAQQSVHGKGTVKTTSFHTAMAGETLVAFVAADGPASSGAQQATVSGAGLTWSLVKRANSQYGDSEVWTAPAPAVLSSATVSSTLSRNSYSQDLTVIAMEGVKGIGASVAGSGARGAPSLSLTTAGSTSLVFAVGNDWDKAITRTLPVGWVLLDQWLNTGSGDDYWSQYTNNPTGPVGSVVAVGDAAPTTDRWNLVGVELLNDGG